MFECHQSAPEGSFKRWCPPLSRQWIHHPVSHPPQRTLTKVDRAQRSLLSISDNNQTNIWYQPTSPPPPILSLRPFELLLCIDTAVLLRRLGRGERKAGCYIKVRSCTSKKQHDDFHFSSYSSIVHTWLVINIFMTLVQCKGCTHEFSVCHLRRIAFVVTDVLIFTEVAAI